MYDMRLAEIGFHSLWISAGRSSAAKAGSDEWLQHYKAQYLARDT